LQKIKLKWKVLKIKPWMMTMRRAMGKRTQRIMISSLLRRR